MSQTTEIFVENYFLPALKDRILRAAEAEVEEAVTAIKMKLLAIVHEAAGEMVVQVQRAADQYGVMKVTFTIRLEGRNG